MRFVSPHRSMLHPKTVEALMCAQSWLWSEFNGMEIITLFIEVFILLILFLILF